MPEPRLFSVLAERGQKQRWLLDQLRVRGYPYSETYLSQVKSGAKTPSVRFREAAAAVLGRPEKELFEMPKTKANGRSAKPSRKSAKPLAKSRTAGKTVSGRNPINVAIIGVGNCASSLVQGVTFYQDARPDERVPGLMHVDLGGYHVRDVNFVAAFDINANKVGKDLSEAIYAPPNNTFRFADVPYTGVRVSRGMTHDGIGKYLEDVIPRAPGPTDDIVAS